MTNVKQGGPARSTPDMIDPADRDVHTGETLKPNAPSDLADPANTNPDAPHDRTTTRKDGRHEGAGSQMLEQVKKSGETEAWRKGKTQDAE